MTKEYIKPQVEVISFEPEEMLMDNDSTGAGGTVGSLGEGVEEW